MHNLSSKTKQYMAHIDHSHNCIDACRVIHNNLFLVENYIFSAVFLQNKQSFLFELFDCSDSEYVQVVDVQFDFLLESGVLTNVISGSSYSIFPQYDTSQTYFQYVICPLTLNNSVEGLLIVAFDKKCIGNDDDYKIQGCLFQSSLLNNYFEIQDLRKTNSTLQNKLNTIQNIRVNEKLSDNNLLNSLINSLPIGLVIVNKENKQIIKHNSVAQNLLSPNKQDLIDQTLNQFLSYENTLFDVYLKSILIDTSGRNVPIMRYSTVVIIEGVEFIIETISEVDEQKDLQEFVNGHNQGLESLVEEKSKDLFEVMAKLEKSIERVKLSEEAAANEKRYSELKTKFLLMISHELRTPLTVIRNNVEIIKSYHQRLTDIQYEQYTSHILSAVEFISTILLNVNKFQAEISDVKKEGDVTISAYEQIRMKVNEATQNTSSKKVDIEIQVPKELEIGYTVDTFSPIITNIIGNMFAYSRDDVKGIITYSLEGNFHCFVFQDSGIGIPPENLPRITELFYRGNNTINRPGIGIGLTIVQKILDFMGGTIDIESVENEYTKVTIKIPILPNN